MKLYIYITDWLGGKFEMFAIIGFLQFFVQST